jgi:leucyl aminopeptidase
MELIGNVGRYQELTAQGLVVPVFSGEQADAGILQELDAATGGVVASVLASGEMKGKDGDVSYIHLNSHSGLAAQRLLLLGAGEQNDYRAPQVAQLAGAAARFLRGKKVASVAFVPRLDEAAAAAEGAITGLFDTDKYKTKGQDEKGAIDSFTVCVTGADAATVNAGVERGRIIGESVNFTRELANEPGNEMTPTDMADRARGLAAEFGLEIDVLDEARMEQEGMGALLGVSRGSEEPAQLIVLKYTPANPPQTTDLLAFVGKGLTFDTGGISIKPAENMELMKYDMSGGAAVLGALRAIAQLKPAMPVVGVVPSSENMPSGRAQKPGDIVTTMAGKTVEVINTDAEGRLILCDAITYARKLGATRIVDMATLTGAVVIALGDVNTAVLGNDQALIDEIIATGKETGEKFWQLPLDKEYTKQLKSDIADLKNVGGRKAGTITASAFLKEFAEGVAWAHLDIAGTAWGDDAKSHRAKGPTGVPVRTLIKMTEK